MVANGSELSKTRKNESTELAKVPKRPQKKILLSQFDSIMESLSQGTPLDKTLQSLGIDWKTFHRYLDESPEARQTYSRARRYCVEKWVDQIVPMSDAVIGEDMHVVTATRNAVEARKWMAGKLAPREYGDQPAGVTINNNTNVLVMTDDKLKALQEARRRMLDAGSTQV